MKKIILSFFAAGFVLLLFIVGAAYWLFKNIDYQDLNSCLKASVSHKVLCPSKNSDYVKLSEISPYFLDAVVLSEDDKFYSHKGFDWKEIKNSFWKNLESLSFARGGSTISQQLVKNVYLSHEKSLMRKLKEAMIASQLEARYPKKLILEKYVNAIEFGPNLWGIKAASEHYFQSSPGTLVPLEALYLTVLLPSPKVYSKTFEEGKLTPYQERRIRNLLKRLKKRGKVDPAYADILLEEISDFPWRMDINQVLTFEEEEEIQELDKEIIEDFEASP